MICIPITDLLTILVDDWVQAKGKHMLKGKPGARPEFTDCEVITLMVAQDFIPYSSEAQYIAFIRANDQALFPKLLDQSQFNRRERS